MPAIAILFAGTARPYKFLLRCVPAVQSKIHF
jgi:hypothetical protein